VTPASNGSELATTVVSAASVDVDEHATTAPQDLYDSSDDEAKPSYASDLREAGIELWRFREMLYQLTLRDVRIRYKQAVIGFGWALLMPALARRMVGRGKRAVDLQSGDFWALRDVSFTVQPGEALGIIGPNGAGKSTVLKLLTRIVRPTRGACAVQGRIGALIELSAGFHPDLTGRENVYLQGSIMGMHRREIAGKFDEIVEFAGIADFIDTPVKRYSSGMHARLGFAIAAHLDPDVLIIDEVLAVGDAAFQKKAFGRIAAMREDRVPLVVVSHQLDRIAQLCTKAILLNRGRVVHSGAPGETIAAYVGTTASSADPIAGDSAVKIASMDVSASGIVPSGGTLTITLTGTVQPNWTGRRVGVMFRVTSVVSGQVIF
jgi:ABC-type polysaccharide/polyol phosphate transport system ATPase subunit